MISYKEQIELIQAVNDGKTIAGRKKGTDEWVTHNDRVVSREIFYGSKYVQFNFQDFDYKIVNK